MPSMTLERVILTALLVAPRTRRPTMAERLAIVEINAYLGAPRTPEPRS